MSVGLYLLEILEILTVINHILMILGLLIETDAIDLLKPANQMYMKEIG